MAEQQGRSLWQSIQELVNPLYVSEAQAAPWPEVVKAIEKVLPGVFSKLSKSDTMAMEMLTEAYPAVRGTRFSSFRSLHPSYYVNENLPIGERPVYMAGYTPGEIAVTLPGARYKNKLFRPELAYSHEGSHALTGGSNEWTEWLFGPDVWFPQPKDVEDILNKFIRGRIDPTLEGFAEGASHSLLDRLGNKAMTPYYDLYRAKNIPSEVLGRYMSAGQVGADVGSSLRRGIAPRQQHIIDTLYDIITGKK